MSESNQRGVVIKALRSLDAIAVENPALPGTPDVNYVEGWIELKELPRWPKNSEVAPVRVEHYTPQQRRWHVNRRLANGNCWFVLKVDNEWLIFDAAEAALVVGVSTQKELYLHAEFCLDKFEPKEFLECISTPMRSCYSSAEDRVKLRQKLLEVLRSLSAAT